jgi:protocatechuate 3,4-dioxygenase beta subunit
MGRAVDPARHGQYVRCLPGVTVSSESRATGSATAVTDGSGRYTVANLRPGTYTVTFIRGFNKLIRKPS